jgi:hypothetical protein
VAQPQTGLHYAPNGNFANGGFNAPGDPGSDGFNVADVGSVSAADALPSGDVGLVWWGQTSGVTSGFKHLVNAAAGDPKVLGIYVADEPSSDPTTVSHLRAEVQYINAHAPNKLAFIVAENNGSPESPVIGYSPSALGMTASNDVLGVDPYPVRPEFPGGMDLGVIDKGVAAAESAGWPVGQLVPVYQAFGGGDYASWTLPTATQEQQILNEWGNLTPAPRFDYAYSWGTQGGDSALANSPDLQQVFAAHNAGS